MATVEVVSRACNGNRVLSLDIGVNKGLQNNDIVQPRMESEVVSSHCSAVLLLAVYQTKAALMLLDGSMTFAAK